MCVCASFVELLHARIEVQQNGLMISNGEEYPAPALPDMSVYRKLSLRKFGAFQIELL
jgi:hypothetical protein